MDWNDPWPSMSPSWLCFRLKETIHFPDSFSTVRVCALTYLRFSKNVPLLHTSRYIIAHDSILPGLPRVSTAVKTLGWEGLCTRLLATLMQLDCFCCPQADNLMNHIGQKCKMTLQPHRAFQCTPNNTLTSACPTPSHVQPHSQSMSSNCIQMYCHIKCILHSSSWEWDFPACWSKHVLQPEVVWTNNHLENCLH